MKRKSVATAVVLAAILGPIGLAYVSIGQAVLGVILLVVGYVAAATTGDIGVMTKTIGVFWLIFVAVAWSMSRKNNAEIDKKAAIEERKHKEILAALSQRAN